MFCLVVGISSGDAGGASRPGLTSVLKERGGKENLRSGLLYALDKKKKKQRSVNCYRFIQGSLQTSPRLEDIIGGIAAKHK